MKALIAVAVLALPYCLAAQTISSAPDTKAIFEHAKAASVLVLAGDGQGRVSAIAAGVIVSKDGEILTAYHAIKGAAAVQVRMASGEIFDHVEQLGVDERRDVVALKISAGALPALTVGSSANLALGDPVFAVTNASGLSWMATEGVLYAVSPANEIHGAGSGFNLLRFTAAVAPGATGGALVDRASELVGIITCPKEAAAPFAVPIENVAGLAEVGPRIALGSGASLQVVPEQAEAPQPSPAASGSDPKLLLADAKTICIQSETAFLTVDTLQRALFQQKDWAKLGLTIVESPRTADLIIKVDRLIFTNIHTYVISSKATGIVLASGKVAAFNGIIASGPMGKEIVKIFADARLPAGPAK